MTDSNLIRERVLCCHCRKCWELELPFNSTIEQGIILVTTQGGEQDGQTTQAGTVHCPRCHSGEVNSIDL